MIKGITPRLAEAGKIKIGGLGEERTSRSGTKFRLPVKYDYFLVTTTDRTEKGDLEVDAVLMGDLGADEDGHVRSIPIVLHSDVIDEVFLTAYARYSGRRCACRGDGENALRREVKEGQHTGASKEIDCPCDLLKATNGTVCKANGKLLCSIDVPNAAIAGAVHIWRTTSIISIEQMIGSLMQIKAMCGTLRGVPLWLRVKPITVEPPGQGAITVYCCHVELRAADIADIQRDALDAAKRRHELGLDDSEYGKMLTLPAHDETSDEESEIAQEFYPEDSSNVNGEETATPDASPMDALTEKLRKEAEGKDPEPSKPAAEPEVPGRDVQEEISRIAKVTYGADWLNGLEAVCDANSVNMEKMSDEDAIKIVGILSGQIEGAK